MAKASKASEDTEKRKAPVEREVTGTQEVARSGVSGLLGFSGAPRGDIKTYQKMRNDPTIALARMTAMVPIRSMSWTVQADDDVPDDVVEFITTELQKHWFQFIKDILLAWDYGYQPFEKVWKADRNGHWTYRKLKALAPGKTEIIVEKSTGEFLGFRQGKVTIPLEKCFLYTYDGEHGNLYGRSRNENVRATWHRHEELLKRVDSYVTKVAGVIPLVEYPMGKGRDASGSEVDNYDLAVRLLGQLGQGNGVAMPNTLSKFAEELVRNGAQPDQVRAWHIEFLEPRSAHGSEFVELLRHFETLMIRGWLVPERTISEGQYGTKAEAETHMLAMKEMSALELHDILTNINQQIVDPLLYYNFGEDYEGRVYVIAEQADPALAEFFRELVLKIYGEPMNLDIAKAVLDFDSILDLANIPKLQDVVNMKDAEKEAEREAELEAENVAMARQTEVGQGQERNWLERTIIPWLCK